MDRDEAEKVGMYGEGSRDIVPFLSVRSMWDKTASILAYSLGRSEMMDVRVRTSQRADTNRFASM